MNRAGMDINHEEILVNIVYLLENKNFDYVRNILTDLHPADIADYVERMDADYRNQTLSLLNPDIASEVLAELEDATREDLLEEMDSSKIAELINEMDSDDATDVMDTVMELSEDKANEVLAQVEDEYSEEIQELLHYPEDSAGGIMAKEYVAVNANFTVNQAIQELRSKREEVEDIYQCYVVDDVGKLVGYVPLKDMILARGESLIKDIMDTEVFAIASDMDQEQVAHIFEKYDLVSAPVVNHAWKLIGRITIDDILDVINEETDEDLGRIAGTGEEEILEESVFRIAQARLPWLIISFFGEMLSAVIMSFYSATINQIVASAFFIPLVMAIGGSTGQQSSIIVVRGLATGEINPLDIRRRLYREFRTAIINGFVIATLIFSVAMFWLGDGKFASVLSGTLMIVVLNASIFGAIIPFIFKKFEVDPALATGPFVATFNDVIGLMIYFTLLAMSLKYILVA